MIPPGDTKQGGSTSTHSTRQYSPDNPSSPPSPMTVLHFQCGTDIDLLVTHKNIEIKYTI